MPPTPQKHRITRTAVRTLAACTLFLVWYVGSWLVYSGLVGRGAIRSAKIDVIHDVIFGPIHGYLISGYPGARDLYILHGQCQSLGWRSTQKAVTLKVRDTNSSPEAKQAQP
jgi:hypothetical protein